MPIQLVDDESLAMDLDAPVEQISASVEDAEIDPALLSLTGAPPTLHPVLNGAAVAERDQKQVPVHATPPRRTPKKASPPKVNTATSVGRRASTAVPNGASMSPPASARSARGKTSASPIIPQGLSPEEEASLRVALQLQAEQFGLRRRGT